VFASLNITAQQDDKEAKDMLGEENLPLIVVVFGEIKLQTE